MEVKNTADTLLDDLPREKKSTSDSYEKLKKRYHKDPIYSWVLEYIRVNPGSSLLSIKDSLGLDSTEEVSSITNVLVELKYVNNLNNTFTRNDELGDIFLKDDPIEFGKTFKLDVLRARLLNSASRLEFGKGHLSKGVTIATNKVTILKLNDKLQEVENWLIKESNMIEQNERKYICDYNYAVVNAVRDEASI